MNEGWGKNVNIRPKLTVREILRGTSVSHTRTEISVRDVETILDGPGIFCPVAKMIRSAGTPINEVWNIARP